jgi:uncharacterized protein (TIGR02449 family)
MYAMEVTDLMNSSTELNHLELQVDSLIRGIGKLQAENKALREQVRKAVNERDIVLAQKQRAILQVKELIAQVKETGL